MIKRLAVILIVLAGAVLLWAESGAVVTANPSPSALAALSPADVTEAYYVWYLDYLNSEVMCHPLLDGAYQDSPYLAGALVSRLDALVADSCGFGLRTDPFLCGTDVPDRISVLALESDSSAARVAVYGSFPTEARVSETRPLGTASLIYEDGHWNLDSVACP